MELLGERNWWAPKPLLRLRARLSAARNPGRVDPVIGIAD
jgi:hypothetical protein